MSLAKEAYGKFTPQNREQVQQKEPGKGLDLRRFPKVTFRKNRRRWYRNHGPHGPWYFDSSRLGRYNLTAPYGTLYVASTKRGALGERIGPDFDVENGVHPSLLKNRYLSTLTIPFTVKSADFDCDEALMFGVNASIATMTSYNVPQSWAQHLFQAGFGGLLAPLKYTGGRAKSLAVFGAEHGRPDWTHSIHQTETLQSICVEHGFPVWPSPSSHDVVVL